MRKQHPNSLANLKAGQQPSGRSRYNVMLSPAAKEAIEKLGKNRGEGIDRMVTLLEIAITYLKDSDDAIAKAWVDEVEPAIAQSPKKKAVEVKNKEGETTAWIV